MSNDLFSVESIVRIHSEANPAFLEKLEKIADQAGVKDIKYVKVPPNAIFKHKGLPHEYAIVITMEMDKELLENAPIKGHSLVEV